MSGAFKRIHQLTEITNLSDEDVFVFEREISSGVWRTFSCSARTIKNYVDGVVFTDALLLESGDFFLLETGDKLLLE
jgi:hypothetical protein